MKKISIIIPIFNGEKFLKKCVNSVINQTYKNIEILLLNDGSTDNSLKIIKDYEMKYPEIIKSYSHDNVGQGETRNRGIDIATGDYITFIDCDDYVSCDYIETMIKNIDNNDILITGYKRVDENYNLMRTSIPRINEWTPYKYCSTCGKLYLLSFFRDNSLKYGKFKIGEDIYLFLSAISKTNKIKVMEYAGYINFANITSVTNTANKDKSTRTDMIGILKEIELLDKTNLDINKLLFFYSKACAFHILTQSGLLNSREIYQENKIFFNWLCSIYEKYDKKIKFYWQYGEDFKVNAFVNILVFCNRIRIIKPLLLIIQKMSGQEFK